MGVRHGGQRFVRVDAEDRGQARLEIALLESGRADRVAPVVSRTQGRAGAREVGRIAPSRLGPGRAEAGEEVFVRDFNSP